MAIMPAAAGQVAPASLTVTVTDVINDNGGTREAADFTIVVWAFPSFTVLASFPGSESGTTVQIPPGQILVGGSLGGYGATWSGQGVRTVAAGGTYFTTVLYNDIAPTLNLLKEVVNDSGGTASAGDW